MGRTAGPSMWRHRDIANDRYLGLRSLTGAGIRPQSETMMSCAAQRRPRSKQAAEPRPPSASRWQSPIASLCSIRRRTTPRPRPCSRAMRTTGGAPSREVSRTSCSSRIRWTTRRPGANAGAALVDVRRRANLCGARFDRLDTHPGIGQGVAPRSGACLDDPVAVGLGHSRVLLMRWLSHIWMRVRPRRQSLGVVRRSDRRRSSSQPVAPESLGRGARCRRALRSKVSPTRASGPMLTNRRRGHGSRHRRSASLFTSCATTSTWEVIGKMSKARSRSNR